MITPRDRKAWRLGRARVAITLERCYCPCHNTALGAKRADPQAAAEASGCWCLDYHCPALKTPAEERELLARFPPRGRARALAAWDPRWGEPRPAVQPPPAEAAGGSDDDGN